MPPAVTSPNILVDPGFLWVAPVGTADPTNTVAGSVFTDAIPVAWLPLGATTEGSTFSYSTSVEPIRVAELFDPVRYATTERGGSISFNLASYTLSNYRRALNGGIAAMLLDNACGATASLTVDDSGRRPFLRPRVLKPERLRAVVPPARRPRDGRECPASAQTCPEGASPARAPTAPREAFP